MRYITATILVLGLVMANPGRALGAAIGAEEAYARAAAGELVLIDVRLPREWAATGVPPGAKLIPLQNSLGLPRSDFADEVVQALGGELGRPIALICARGGRSAFADRALRARGFTEVYNVAEGVLGSSAGPGWLAQGLEVVPCPVC